ncbi:MAG: DinB family protein [Saprospiraceae bacterium]|nr:DinB family protein [Saprospiraceae bacterium]
MGIQNFNQTIDVWINGLAQYDFDQLRTKPAQNSWSLGQVYMHLLENTGYFIEQVQICIANDDHTCEEALPAGKMMLLNQDFPDEALEGPPENADTPQPESMEQLLNSLIQLKEDARNAGVLMAESRFNGKTKHPGLGYFNASEWLQFAEMHLRHHLRQKKRIDEFLKTNFKSE